MQTCLGALAALDAYTGAVAWLDIYPTGRQPMERQQFNQFVQGNQMQAPAHKPWVFNPVIVQDGIVFTLPTINEEHSGTNGENTSRNLLIYDAATGVEIQRIDIKNIEQNAIPHGESAAIPTSIRCWAWSAMTSCCAGDNGIVCLNWKNYVKENVRSRAPTRSDHITNWLGNFR